jgi:hypothetical protein
MTTRGKPKKFGENLLQRHLVHYKCRTKFRGTEKPACNCLSDDRRLSEVTIRSCGQCSVHLCIRLHFFFTPPTVPHSLSSYHRRYIVPILAVPLYNQLEINKKNLAKALSRTIAELRTTVSPVLILWN